MSESDTSYIGMRWNQSDITGSSPRRDTEDDVSLSDTSGIYFPPSADKERVNNFIQNEMNENTQDVLQNSTGEMTVDLGPLLEEAASARSPYSLRSSHSAEDTPLSENSFQDSSSQTEVEKPAGRKRRPAAEKAKPANKKNTNQKEPKPLVNGEERQRAPPKRPRQRRGLAPVAPVVNGEKCQRAPPKRPRQRRSAPVENPAPPLEPIPEGNLEKYHINLNIHIPPSESGKNILLRAEMIHEVPENADQNKSNAEEEQLSTSGMQTAQSPLNPIGETTSANEAGQDCTNLITTPDRSEHLTNLNAGTSAHPQQNIQPDFSETVPINDLPPPEIKKAEIGVQTETQCVIIKKEVESPKKEVAKPNQSNESEKKKKLEDKKLKSKNKARSVPSYYSDSDSDSESSSSSCSCSDCQYTSTSCSCSDCYSDSDSSD